MTPPRSLDVKPCFEHSCCTLWFFLTWFPPACGALLAYGLSKHPHHVAVRLIAVVLQQAHEMGICLVGSIDCNIRNDLVKSMLSRLTAVTHSICVRQDLGDSLLLLHEAERASISLSSFQPPTHTFQRPGKQALNSGRLITDCWYPGTPSKASGSFVPVGIATADVGGIGKVT